MNNNEAIDAEFEEITTGEAVENKITEAKTPPTKQEALDALNNMIKSGDLHSRVAAHLRAQMGIFKSSFTKKQISDKKRKSLRKKQKSARKQQRK